MEHGVKIKTFIGMHIKVYSIFLFEQELSGITGRIVVMFKVKSDSTSVTI